MQVVSFYDEDTHTFSYLVADRDSGQVAIIDPVLGFDAASCSTDTRQADRILEVAEEQAWTPRWILETHAHADHLTAADYLKSRTSAETGIGVGIRSVQQRFSRVYNLGTEFSTDGRQFDHLLKDGDELPLGENRIRVLATPGHTDDGLSYLTGTMAFVGDTLFQPGYGTARCDFPGASAGTLYDSIQKLYQLPSYTRLFLCHDYPEPGHSPRCETTVAESRAHNIHVRADTSRAEFIQRRTERDEQLKMPRLILPALQVNIRAGELPPEDDNGVRYLRLPLNAELASLAKFPES